jgi:hypothetical protein
MRFALPLSMGTLAFVALVGALAVNAPPALAQAVPCTAIKNDAERLACYDRALRPAPSATPATAPAAAPPAAAASAPPAAPSEHLSTSRETRHERRVREAEAAAPPAAPAAPAAPPPSPARSTLSAAANAGSAEAPPVVPIVVVEVRALRGRGSTFITDTGSVWIQSDSEQMRLPEVPFKASLKPGAMSSMFLVPDDYPRAIRVHQDK